MKHLHYIPLLFLLAFASSLSSCDKDPTPDPDPVITPKDTVKVEEGKTFLLELPADDNIYHAAFPNLGGTEDAVSQTKIKQFESLVDKEITWIYFSNNWWNGIKFPKAEVETIRKAGKIPFIRMMPRSNFETGVVDPTYSMQNFLSGRFDNDLKEWALAAKAIDGPLLVEFGTEMNGNWFPWNAEFNGGSVRSYGDPGLYDGMERFRDTYRHIIDIFESQGVNNITWFFHVNAYSGPDEAWNKMKDYYPGDDYIDWIGVSVYGPQQVSWGWWTFEKVMDDTWDEISSISKTGKPIAILEWGVIDYPDFGDKAQWIADALNSISPGGKYHGKVHGLSYWHENFDDTNLKIDSSPEALEAYKAGIASDNFISEAVISN